MDANFDDVVAAFEAARKLFCILFRMRIPTFLPMATTRLAINAFQSSAV